MLAEVYRHGMLCAEESTMASPAPPFPTPEETIHNKILPSVDRCWNHAVRASVVNEWPLIPLLGRVYPLVYMTVCIAAWLLSRKE